MSAVVLAIIGLAPALLIARRWRTRAGTSDRHVERERDMAAGAEISKRFGRLREYRERVIDPQIDRRHSLSLDELEHLNFEFDLCSAVGERIIEDAERWRGAR